MIHRDKCRFTSQVTKEKIQEFLAAAVKLKEVKSTDPNTPPHDVMAERGPEGKCHARWVVEETNALARKKAKEELIGN